MPRDCYFGSYCRFDTLSKNSMATLLSADTLVGDKLTLEFRVEDGASQVWLYNRFEGEIGFLDSTISRQLSIMQARNWSINVMLSFVAYSEKPEPGEYWGEVAIVCFDPKFEESFLPFLQKIIERLQDGIRPDIRLDNHETQALLNDTTHEWFPKKTIPLPKNNAVIMKSRLSTSDKVVELGRKGNIGCYIANFIFIVLLVALVVCFLYFVVFN